LKAPEGQEALVSGFLRPNVAQIYPFPDFKAHMAQVYPFPENLPYFWPLGNKYLSKYKLKYIRFLT
jgi:hypothetical protein